MKNENIEILQSFTKAKLIELHNAKDQHITSLYDEMDKMSEVNETLVKKVLELKAQLHDLLR